jgi:hypothetical protein
MTTGIYALLIGSDRSIFAREARVKRSRDDGLAHGQHGGDDGHGGMATVSASTSAVRAGVSRIGSPVALARHAAVSERRLGGGELLRSHDGHVVRQRARQRPPRRRDDRQEWVQGRVGRGEPLAEPLQLRGPTKIDEDYARASLTLAGGIRKRLQSRRSLPTGRGR